MDRMAFPGQDKQDKTGYGLLREPRSLICRYCIQGPLRDTLMGPSPPLSLGEGPGVRANATTLAVLRANCPKGMAMADWLKLMANPVNAVIYPLHITQEMLDTLDGRKMDLRYRYVLVKTVADER